MIQQFLNHIQRHNLCKTSDKILLAVSGGLDSMVMLQLFSQHNFNIGIAHCNFQLRGEESAGDEAHVKQTCKQLNIPCHTKVFNTKAIAQERKLSIQLAARELRYQYFQELIKQHGYTTIATAHHLNDVLETVILNLTRGTGIDGLTGIPVRTNNIIRPLLFASREWLRNYAVKNNITWREDSSNEKDDYQRNFIRHRVVPLLKEVNPSLEDTFRDTHDRIVMAQLLVRSQLKTISDFLISTNGTRITIDKRNVLELENAHAVLWELLKDYGFNYVQCKDLIQEHIPGKQFYSSKYRIIIDRNSFILEPRKESIPDALTIENTSDVLPRAGESLTFKTVDSNVFKLTKKLSVAQLDADKLVFPMTWRPWKPGDVLIPLGMKTSKKVSDLLIDAKVSLPDKEKITVIESAGEVVWVVGMRINEHYKVTEKTRRVFIIELNSV